MVNTGHPSKACKTCRIRRIKCDETKPACMKCRKSGRVCPGYRSAFDLKLRDETQSVIRKAKMAHRRSTSEVTPPPQFLSPPPPSSRRRAGSDTTSSTFCMPWVQVPYSRSGADRLTGEFKSESDLPFGVIQLGWSLDVNGNQNANSGFLTQLTTPLDQQAACFFLSNFVLSPPKGLGRGFLTFLLTLLETPAAYSTPLSKSFSAVSMASLAGRPNSRTLLNKAQEYYTEAIVQLNETLRDPVKAKEDATLASVILLAFYEGFTSTDDKLKRWSSHLNGAKTLLQMRGPLETFTEEGFAMFEFVRTSMIRQYMFHEAPTVDDIEWLTGQGVTDQVGHMTIALNLTTCLYRTEADRLLGHPAESFLGDSLLPEFFVTSDCPSTSPASLDSFQSSPTYTSYEPAERSPSFYQLDEVARQARVAEVRNLMHKCISNDRQLGGWFEKCPTRWHATVAYVAPDVPDSELSTTMAYPGPVFDFPNVWIAGKLVIANASRLVLLGVIARCIRWLQLHAPAEATNPVSAGLSEGGSPFHGPEQGVDIETVRRTAQGEVRAVLSSIPYFCSWCGDSTTSCFPCGTPEKPKGFAGISCLWPMLAAGASEFNSERERRFIRARLNSIGDTMGIRQATIFARCLARREYAPHIEDHEIFCRTPDGGEGMPAPGMEPFPPFQQACFG